MSLLRRGRAAAAPGVRLPVQHGKLHTCTHRTHVIAWVVASLLFRCGAAQRSETTGGRSVQLAAILRVQHMHMDARN